MSGSTDNARIWADADVYVAPVGATAPDDVTTAWDAAWEALGLLSEDGATEGRDDTVTDHYAWGGILVRTTRSKHKRTIKVTALEDNAVVWGLVNPGSTSETAGAVTTRTVVVPNSDIRAFGMEIVDGDIIKRRVIPRGEVIDVADVKYADAEMTMFELTINIYPDGDGVLYTDITDDPAAESTGS